MKKNNYSTMASIAVNKSLLKEYQTSYGRTVYLDKDSEFQIKLFNPTTETVGADIIINGKSLGEKLVIRPGQIIWLERYFNEARKFRFDVYEVDAKAEAVKEAIRNNGDIQVRFYKERPKQNLWYSNPTYIGYTKSIPTTLDYDYGIRCTGDNVQINSMVNTMQLTPSSCDTAASSIESSIDSNLTFSADAGQLRSATCDSFSATKGIYDGRLPKLSKKRATFGDDNQTMETGRVERGGYSDQRFMEIDIDFEVFSFKTEEIKLLPKSQKPVFKEDLQKLYCTECGRKVKPKFKFCPFCGGKLQEI